MIRRPLMLAATVATLVACATAPGVRSERADQVTTTSQPSPTPSPTTSPTTSSSPAGDELGDGIGDALFPDLGNPGLDVVHYDVELSYDPTTERVDGTVGLDVTLTSARDEITLDAVGLTASNVTVGGESVVAVADGPELRIPLPQPGSAGDSLRIEVSYGFENAQILSPIGFSIGWFNTPGGSYVLNEPDGARSWLPCNDHPSDKATYTFTIAVPAGLTAVANGTLTDHRTVGDQEVWTWQQDDPMATYLIQLLTGDYEVVDGTGPDGLPLISVVLRADKATMQQFIDVTPAMIDFFDGFFGPYPLDSYGIAMTDSFGGLAMETQGRSLFSRDDFLGGLGYTQQLLLSHELAHQWYGDAVSPARWVDIWLNESFATYAQWMWLEHAGFSLAGEEATFALENRPPGSSADPSAQDLFGYNSYDGGAVVLHALRLTIGDDKFFELLRRWATENSGGSRTTADFIDLTQTVAGAPMGDFFDTWLFAEQPPSEFPIGQ
ncbi:MAG: M1 family metallopeptidase [Actinobacteria bacterium]|nr:M1 family metallopeptidase [Actinomycetota bacterium]